MFRPILGILSLFRSFWSSPQWEDDIAGYPFYAPPPTASAMSVAHGVDIHSQREFLRMIIQLLAIIQQSAIFICLLATLHRITKKQFLVISKGDIVSATWNWSATAIAILIPFFLLMITNVYEAHYRTKLGETFQQSHKEDTSKPKRKITQFIKNQAVWLAKLVLLFAWFLLLAATIYLVWPYVSIIASTAIGMLDLYMDLLLEPGIRTIP